MRQAVRMKPAIMEDGKDAGFAGWKMKRMGRRMLRRW